MREENPFKTNFSDKFSNNFIKKSVDFLEDTFFKLLGVKTLEKHYFNAVRNKSDKRPSETFLETLKVNYTIEEGSVANIPKEGPVVLVANHPFGGLEGLIMLDLLIKQRPNAKVLANYILERLPDLRKYFIFVDPFGQQSSTAKNISPMRQMVRWLKKGNILGVFPSGTVSHFNWDKKTITDPEWNTDIARIIRFSKATVVPIYFEDKNSWLFQIAGIIHPFLRTLLIPSELNNKCGKNIKLRIGSPILPAKINKFDDDKELTSYLRLRTYILESINKDQDKEKGKAQNIKAIAKNEEIISPIDSSITSHEIKNLPSEQTLIETKDKLVCFATAEQIPMTLQEIARLREIAFRNVGEGTGKSLDIDRFDNYYTHLFVWNKDHKEIVGAYRLVGTDHILKKFGIKGLYTSTLFDYKPKLLRQMGPALELGRSFVNVKYQKQFSSLHLLWKGIARYVVLNPRYKILFGTVSISNDYDSVSRRLISQFLKENLFLPKLAKLLKAKNPDNSKTARSIVKETSVVVKSIAEVSELIAEIETKHKSVPVLLRQYLKLGGKLLGFNLDKSFSNVLDGLIYIDLTETDRKMLNRYFTEEGASVVIDYHKKKSSKDVRA